MSEQPAPASTRDADLASLRIPPRHRPRRPSWLRGLFSLVKWSVALAAVGFGASHLLKMRPREVTVTRVAMLTPAQAATTLTASGYIVARSKAEISPENVGRVVWLNLEEGQRVKKGDLVAKLNSEDLAAQLRQSEANLNNVQSDLARAQRLVTDKIIPAQDFERLQWQQREAVARMDYIRKQIEKTAIYAPIDGVVTVKKAFLGETVAPQGFGAGSAGATFAVIVDFNTLEMEADINEGNLSKLTNAQPALIYLDAYPDKPYRARLRQIVPTADRQKGAVKVKIELLERDERVLPEMSARVAFLSREVDGAAGPGQLTVPNSSVVSVGGREGVLVVQSNTATFTAVDLGTTNAGLRFVTRGLAGTESLVADAASAKAPWLPVTRVTVKNP
jgi:RND family efflux transporter MFP subunit